MKICFVKFIQFNTQSMLLLNNLLLNCLYIYIYIYIYIYSLITIWLDFRKKLCFSFIHVF